MQTSTRNLLGLAFAVVAIGAPPAALSVYVPLRVAHAQAAAASKYVPSELQLLRLQVKQRDAQLAQIALRDAQRNMQVALQALSEESERVKADNKWPATVQFNFDSMTFVDAPAVTVPAAAQPKQPLSQKQD